MISKIKRTEKDVVDLCPQGEKKVKKKNSLGQEGLERCGCRPMPPGGLGKMWL
jgi:hypothetical protein